MVSIPSCLRPAARGASLATPSAPRDARQASDCGFDAAGVTRAGRSSTIAGLPHTTHLSTGDDSRDGRKGGSAGAGELDLRASVAAIAMVQAAQGSPIEC